MTKHQFSTNQTLAISPPVALNTLGKTDEIFTGTYGDCSEKNTFWEPEQYIMWS